MANARPVLYAFNRGLISPLALARVTENDKAAGRIRLSAEVMSNYIPRVLGSMMLRPGTEYKFSTYNNNKAMYVPFIYAIDDQAKIEFTDAAMRIVIDDEVVSRSSVSSAVTNGSFDTDVSSWTDASEAGCTAAWLTGGYLSLTGTSYNSAIMQQQVTVATADEDTQHALRVVVDRGEVTLKVGTTAGASDYFSVNLTEGEHSLAFTPTGDFHIQISSVTKYASLVDSIEVEGSGDVVITSPYAEADLSLIRWEQSADVIFLACEGYRQYKIERRGTTSWSLVKYYADDGPFRALNLTKTTLTPDAVSGDITITASQDVFKSTSVGGLYKLGSIGQYVEVDATGAGQWSSAITVSGEGATRDISVSVGGTFVATVTLQRSNDEGTTWSDVATYTGAATPTYNDGLDNQELQYRIGVDTGDYTSGTAETSLTYATGSLSGIVRITSYTSATSVDAIVLKELGGTSASSDWSEGEWSDRRGFPTAGKIYESRMCWGGRGKLQASESDAYSDFDPDTEGDSGPINRSIGSGPVDKVNWLHSGSRLVLGTDGAEVVTRQSFDEIMTPTNFGFKKPDGVGSARIPPAVLNKDLVFVGKSETKLYRLLYDSTSYDYADSDMMELVPDIGKPALSRVGTQINPDKRIHAVRSDGNVAIMVSEPAEDVSCWVLFETDGVVEDVIVMPGTVEDDVYYTVKRTINGSTVRYHEKWAQESECQGGTLNKQADSFITYTGSSTTSISGLSHLEGESVVVWAGGETIGSYTVTDGQITGLTDYAGTTVVIQNGGSDVGDIHLVSPSGVIENDNLKTLEGLTVTLRQTGKDLGTYTVSSGAITVSESVTDAVIGLYYKARYRCVKLAYGAQGGTALTQTKRVDHIAPILRNTHYQGLKYGSDFETLYDMPLAEGGQTVEDDTVHQTYDEIGFEFDGEYDTDSRICLQSEAPKPCTVLGVVISMQTYER